MCRVESMDLPSPGEGTRDTVLGQACVSARPFENLRMSGNMDGPEERGWGGGACRRPGGPIPLGYDGAYEGLCDSWDSFSPFPLIRADAGCRACGGNIVQMFMQSQGGGVTGLRRVFDPIPPGINGEEPNGQAQTADLTYLHLHKGQNQIYD